MPHNSLVNMWSISALFAVGMGATLLHDKYEEGQENQENYDKYYDLGGWHNSSPEFCAAPGYEYGVNIDTILPKVKSPHTILFEAEKVELNYNEHQLPEEDQTRILAKVSELKPYDNVRFKIYGCSDQTTVSGFSDVQNQDYNRRLRLERADAMARLVINSGIPADRICVQSFCPTNERASILEPEWTVQQSDAHPENDLSY